MKCTGFHNRQQGRVKETPSTRPACEHLEAKLLEGIAGGPAKQVKRADWERLRRELKGNRPD